MAHVNYFISLWISLSVIGSQLLNELIIIGIKKPFFGTLKVPVVVLIVLILIWRKQKGLSPTSSFARSSKRFKIGHGTILLGHILIAIPLFYSAWSLSFGKEVVHVTVSAFYTAAAIMLALPLYIIGIICIETIRSRKPKMEPNS